MNSRSRKNLRRESAMERLKVTIAAHEANVDLTKRVVEDHAESGSKKFMKFNPNLSAEQIEKLRKKQLERAKIALENNKSKRGS